MYVDARHLKNHHNLTIEEYKEKFPDACLCSERKSKAQSRPGNKGWLGKKFPQEMRKKLSIASKRNVEQFKKNVHTKEAHAKADKTRKSTLLRLYGVTNVAQIPSVRKKLKKIARSKSIPLDIIIESIEAEGYFLLGGWPDEK